MKLSDFDLQIEQWHNGAGEGLELHEFLGLSFDEYGKLLSQKTITFYDEGYYFSNGCDCHEDTFMECWNADLPVNGSCHSREDCYISAMQYFGYPVVEMTQGDCYNWNEDELESIAREWSIVVDFVS